VCKQEILEIGGEADSPFACSSLATAWPEKLSSLFLALQLCCAHARYAEWMNVNTSMDASSCASCLLYLRVVFFAE